MTPRITPPPHKCQALRLRSFHPGHYLLLARQPAQRLQFLIDDKRRRADDRIGQDVLHLGHLGESGLDVSLNGRLAGQLLQPFAPGTPRAEYFDLHVAQTF